MAFRDPASIKDWTSERELSTAERLQSHAQWLRNFRRDSGLQGNNASGLEERVLSYPFVIFSIYKYSYNSFTSWVNFGDVNVVLTSELIKVTSLKQYFPVILFILLYEMVLTFESVDEIPWCYHSNETSSAVLLHGTIYLVCSSNFWVCGWNPMVLPFKWNVFSSTLTWYYLFSM